MKIGGAILLLTKAGDEENKEAWGSLTEICQEYPELDYAKISRYRKKDFPIKHVDSNNKLWKIEHLKFRTKRSDYKNN